MATNMTPLTQLASWKALEKDYRRVKPLHLRNLFKEDPRRAERFFHGSLGDLFGLFQKQGYGRHHSAFVGLGSILRFAETN